MDNATEVKYAPAWVPEPNGRGTWGILYSCVFTLTLCVWSAIHLNIPPKGESDSIQYWRKTKWVFIAIFAPEAVLYSAWQQFYLARRFCREMQNLCRDHYNLPRVDPRTIWEIWIDKFIEFIRKKIDGLTDDNGGGGEEASLIKAKALPRPSVLDHVSAWYEISDDVKKEIASFSMTYGFYVIMGGFVVHTGDIYDHERAQWLTLTPRGVIEFAKTLPWADFKRQFSIDERQIKDKSKADSLTKVLVILQVVWAALNSISRLTLGYPITVLEVHTLVHAGCAMLMYVLWFRKPLDIRDPSPVNTDGFRDKLALMVVRSPGSAFKPAVDFELPLRWARNVGYSSDYPDTSDASEATFLCFDASEYQQEAGPNSREKTQDGQDVYSILPYLPDDPPDEESDEEDSSDAAEIGDGASELARIQSDVFRDASGSVSESESEKDMLAQKADFEASLGTAFKSRHIIDMPFEMPDIGISRHPPDIQMRSEAETRSKIRHRIHHKVLPATEPVPIAITLTTGEFLKSGIGPAALLTSQGSSFSQRRYEDYLNWTSKYIPRIKGPADRIRSWFAPAQTRLVEVDERLRPFVAVPGPQWDKDHATGIRSLPKRKDTYYHKITAELSAKDVTRWTRACEAFRMELLKEEEAAAAKEPTSSEVLDEKAITLSDPWHPDPAKKPKKDAAVGVEPKSSDNPNPTPFAPSLKTLWKSQYAGDSTMFTLSSFCYRSQNIDFYALLELSSDDGGRFAAMYVAMTYISCIYAGIHLALWNHVFPTRAESILWKISGITLGIWAPLFVLLNCVFWIYLAGWPFRVLKRFLKDSGVCMACFAWVKMRWSVFAQHVRSFTGVVSKMAGRVGTALENIFNELDEWLKKKYKASKAKRGLLYWICRIGEPVLEKLLLGIGYTFIGILYVVFVVPFFAAIGAVVLLYAFARVYIVTESFLSLRHVPVGVYEDVSWAQYIPHL